MPWLLLDVIVAVLGLAVLAWMALRLWRQVRALGREVSAATERIAGAQAGLDALRARTAGERSPNRG